jgi:CDP-diacylglycerol--serine O-phosphatidyltransferase
MNTEENGQVRSRRAIYLLPNMITTMSLFSGFVSVVSSLDGEYMRAALAIIIAGVFDALDGRVARMTGTSSLFGVQYDSLCDALSFGAAPAILMYTAILQPLGRFGWLGAFLFMACGTLRLARFNVQTQRVGEKHFTGLPIPAAAGMVAITVLLVGEDSLKTPFVEAIFIVGAYVLGLLMVSTIPYPSLKQVVIPRRKAFQVLALVVVLLVIAANHPVYFLFGFGIFYVVLGPLLGPWIVRKLGSGDVKELETFTIEDEDILENTGEEVVTRHGAKRE